MYLTVEDLMKKFKVGRTTVYKLIADKKLRSVKISGCRRFRIADVDAYEATLLCRTKN
jgi:excisionase family DNA binding protein